MTERLQKALARAGVASRRKSELLIAQGRVSVNGVLVKTMGSLVDPSVDDIRVDGRPISLPSEPEYWKLNKPPGVVSTAKDDRGRTTVLDLVESRRRLYPVGRLDMESEGLVLLTDDGQAAQILMHPRHEHTKEYRVLVAGSPTSSALEQLRTGILLQDGLAVADSVSAGPSEGEDQWLLITLHQGKKRQIRRMLEAVGHRVIRLVRTRIGPIELGSLESGQAVRLTGADIRALNALKKELLG